MMSDFETLSGLVPDRIIFCGVLVADLHPADFSVQEGGSFPVISDLICHIIVLGGKMDVTIDRFSYECTPDENNVVDIKPMNEVSSIRLSNDFSGKMVVISRQFLDTVLKGRKPIRASELFSLKMHTVATFSESEISSILRYYKNIEESPSDSDDRFDMAIFCYSVLLLHLNMVKMMRSKISSSENRYKATRAGMILDAFFKLLSENVEKEHEVVFYAERLCITPHYLTLVTNRYTGRPAGRIILEELASVACQLLHNPDLSIQDIADRLNFSDQSSFGKFFRRHTGTTPAAYRKNAL